MPRRSASIRSQQLKLEGERGSGSVEVDNDDLLNVRKDVSSCQVVSSADPQGINEASSSSSSSLSIPSPRERALQNPVILQHLFKLCPARIVAPCRLVCKQWYNESLVTWRTRFPLYVFLRNREIILGKKYYDHKLLPPIRTPLKEFLKFINKPKNQCRTKPYRKLKLAECRYSVNSGGFNMLWKAIGNNLTTLNLTCCKFSRTDDFRQVIFKCCPVLQDLKVIYCQFPLPHSVSGIEDNNAVEYQEPLYGEHKFLRTLKMRADIGTKTFPVSWIELLSHFPWLTSLTVSLCGEVGAEFEVLMEAIQVIRRRGKNKLPLKRFAFSPHLTISGDSSSHRHFAHVKELRLPLTNCSIRVHPELDERFVRNTLDYLAPSVRTIELMQGEMDQDGHYEPPTTEVEIPSWFLDFPFEVQLNNLTRLESRGNSCGTFTFLKYAPNLSILDVVNPYPDDSGMTPPVMKVISNTCIQELANVKMLRLWSLAIMELNVSDKDLQSLFEWMPNITDLGMVLNQKQLRMVCKNWKNLVQLTVYGMPPTNERITRSKTERKKAEEFDLLPIIENLKCLEYFFYESEFTLEHVFIMFLRVPSLQNFSNGDWSVERKNLDLESYQRAIKDNVLQQWIADNKSILEEYEEDEESSESDFDESDESDPD